MTKFQNIDIYTYKLSAKTKLMRMRETNLETLQIMKRRFLEQGTWIIRCNIRFRCKLNTIWPATMTIIAATVRTSSMLLETPLQLLNLCHLRCLSIEIFFSGVCAATVLIIILSHW